MLGEKRNPSLFGATNKNELQHMTVERNGEKKSCLCILGRTGRLTEAYRTISIARPPCPMRTARLSILHRQS